MKIRMKIEVHGVFHNITDGVRRGDVVEVDDTEGARYCALGYAEPVVETREERAVPTAVEEQRDVPKPARRTKAKPAE